MTLANLLRPQPLHVAFGRGPGSASGTITQVALDSTRDADSVTITADDGSFVVIPGASHSDAGTLTADDKRKIDALAGGSGGATLDFASRAAAQAAAIPAFQDFLRIAGYYEAGDGGGGLYRRVSSLPGHPLSLATADGSFWELVPENGIINVLQAGARGDGNTDDAPAFLAAFSAFTYFSNEDDQGLTILVPPTRRPYRCAQTLDIKHRIRLRGHGFYTDRYPQIEFDNNVAGIVVNNAESLGVSGQPGASTRATWSWIEGLTIRGGGSDLNAHGITLRAKVRLRDCMAIGFPGNGFHIEADNRAINAPFGNVNHSHLIGLTAMENKGHGFYVQGFDTNAMTIIGLDASRNGRFGIWEQSFLGNTYIGAHMDSNGIPGIGGNNGSQSCLCTYNGQRYYAHYSATESELRTTEPGTNDNVWRREDSVGSSGRYLEWTTSNEVGRFHAGGPATFFGSQNRGVICGYIEPFQGGFHLNARSGWFGGHNVSPTYGSGKAERGNLVYNGGQIYQFRRDGEPDELEIRIREGADQRMIAFLRNGGDLAEWYYDEDDRFWGFANNRSFPKIIFPGDGHSMRAGRPEPIPNFICFPDGVVLGDPRDKGRQIIVGDGPPSGGDHARGEIVFDNAPSAGGWVGWVCVEAGTPGVWKQFGAIEPDEPPAP